MERKRVAGRFVRQGLDGDGGAKTEGKTAAVGAPPRPMFCRTYTRARVVAALPEIVERFVKEAKNGSIAHTKMLANLGGLDKSEAPQEKRRRGKSVVGLLLEDLAREPEEPTERQ